MAISPKGQPEQSPLYLLAVNLTERCNLACAHCYMDARTLRNGAADELHREEVLRLLEAIAQRSRETMVVLTGGEPLLRGDLEDFIAHGHGLGLAMVVGSNGLGLSAARVRALKAAGAMGVGISLDSLDPERHDAFRGVPGAWARTLEGIEACKREGLPFQIHFSVTEGNAGEVPEMIDFARAVGARVLNVFFLVCTGRGEKMSDITPASYERVLEQLVAAQERSADLLIRARCAPHFKRIAYQRDPASSLTRAAGYEGGGCLAGIHYARITPKGEVTACPYIPLAEGSIRDRDFWEIWDGSERFQTLRHPRLEGKCGVCEYRQLCGGCRARPLAQGEGIWAADSWCGFTPRQTAVIEPLRETAGAVAWSGEALARLERVPSFLRKMVKNRAECYVQELGLAEVGAEHLAALAAKRFGEAGPPRPGKGAVDAMPPVLRAQPESLAGALPWSEEALARLTALPGFLQDGVRAVAEEVARAEGRLEVNVKLFERLTEDAAKERSLAWQTAAEARLAEFLASKSTAVRVFVASAMEEAAEEFARRRRALEVTPDDAVAAIERLTGGVDWDPQALARVLAAPDFIRAGIKKAAEFNARREGLARIGPEDLTRFRNRAMLRAVQRMKGFGLRELSFDAYQIARARVPRLKDNPEADKRFAAIRDFVARRPQPGDLLGAELLEKMRAELGNAPAGSKNAGAGPKTVGSDEAV